VSQTTDGSPFGHNDHLHRSSVVVSKRRESHACASLDPEPEPETERQFRRLRAGRELRGRLHPQATARAWLLLGHEGGRRRHRQHGRHRLFDRGRPRSSSPPGVGLSFVRDNQCGRTGSSFGGFWSGRRFLFIIFNTQSGYFFIAQKRVCV